MDHFVALASSERPPLFLDILFNLLVLQFGNYCGKQLTDKWNLVVITLSHKYHIF